MENMNTFQAEDFFPGTIFVGHSTFTLQFIRVS